MKKICPKAKECKSAICPHIRPHEEMFNDDGESYCTLSCCRYPQACILVVEPTPMSLREKIAIASNICEEAICNPMLHHCGDLTVEICTKRLDRIMQAISDSKNACDEG